MTSLIRRVFPRGRSLNYIAKELLSQTPRYTDLPISRSFHLTHSKHAVRPYFLADIGEGITECRVVRWFVKPGDKVNQFDAICEVESDKASVEITSRYDGTITALRHQVDDMAIVGKPLLDIEVEEQITQEPEPTVDDDEETPEQINDTHLPITTGERGHQEYQRPFSEDQPAAGNSGHILPAVRLMLKEHAIDLKDVPGTGKGGRVLKEDVQRYLDGRHIQSGDGKEVPIPALDTVVPLTPIENRMLKTMTKALSIPHFGFTHSVDVTSLNQIRKKFNKSNGRKNITCGGNTSKVTSLSIFMKALSAAFHEHPKINAHLDLESDSTKLSLILKKSHNFGIAVDTPNGLLVPVVKDVQNRSIVSIAEEIKRLSDLAKDGTLKTSDLQDATFIVSNIGSIGGNVVSPVIVPPMVAIVAIGKIEDVPRIINGENGLEIQDSQATVLSWSADHRILDGASVARCAQLTSTIIENIDAFGLVLR